MTTRHIIFLFVLLLAALAPYCYAACCVVPLADDYCGALEAVRHPDLLSAIIRMYLKWHGRYTTDLCIMVNPFMRWGNRGYELASLAIIATGVCISYAVARRLISGEANRWLTALTVQLLFLFQLPDLSEGIYWYNGYMLYYLSGLVLTGTILLATDVIGERWSVASYVKALLCSILIFVVAGFNEPMAAISLLFFAGLFVFTYRRYPNKRLFTGLLFLSALASGIIVCAAPGNSVRAGQFHFDRSIVKVVLMTHLQIVRFIADWVSNLPFIFLSIVVMVRARMIKGRWLDDVKLWWIGGALYAVMILCIMLPYWFTGILGQQRTVNMAYFFFIPLTVFALVKISRSGYVFSVIAFLSEGRAMVSMVAVAVIFMAVTKNGYKLGYDIAYGTLPKYKVEQIGRQKLLEDNLHNDTFRLPPIENRPLSITLYDERNPKFYWVELCQKQYLLKKEARDSH